MTFIKRRTNKGPKTEPCGTPHVIVLVSDDVLFKRIYVYVLSNDNDNDQGLFSKIWFLMEYVRDYIIIYLQYIIYTDNTLVL